MMWGTEPGGDIVRFELENRQYQFRVARPTLEEVKARYLKEGGRWNLVYDPQAKVDAEWRRRWRALVLLLKAKLEFVEAGDTTLEQELMPALLAKNGQTLGELIHTEAGEKLLLGSGA